MRNNEFLKPSINFYRLNYLFGAFLYVAIFYISKFLDHSILIPDWILFMLPLNAVVLIYLSYKWNYFIRKIREIYVVLSLLTSFLFFFFSYATMFHYGFTIGQIIFVLSTSFVIANIREVYAFIIYFLLADAFFISLNYSIIAGNELYKYSFLSFHLFLFMAIGLSFITIVSRFLMMKQFSDLIRAKDLAVEFTLESRKEVEDIKYALNASSIVAITDANGRITYANSYFETLSGYNAQELIGENHRIINSGYHSKEFFADMWRTILSGKVWKGEIRNRKKTGEYYWVATTIVPLMDNKNKPNRFISIRHDITNRKQAEEKLRLSEDSFRNLYRNIKEDLQLASETQKYLMPKLNPIPGFQWKAYVNPYMDVSGDLITMRENRDGSIDIFLADIAGHGVSSALISAVVVLAFQQMGDFGERKTTEPSDCLHDIRETIQGLQMEEFVCGVFLHLDIRTKILSYSYAGQLPGLLHRNKETIVLEGKGMPLFSQGEVILNNYETQLQSGDMLLFFSDGVYEIASGNDALLGYDLFRDIAHEAFLQNELSVIDFVMNALMEYSMNSPMDDISMFFLAVE